MNQPWSLLQDTAHNSHVVNTPESTACKGDVPLLIPLTHLLRALHKLIIWWNLKTASLMFPCLESSLKFSWSTSITSSISYTSKLTCYLHYTQRWSGQLWYVIAQLTRLKCHMFQNTKQAGITLSSGATVGHVTVFITYLINSSCKHVTACDNITVL